MAKSPFLGPTYQTRSSDLASNRAINLYVEVIDGPKGTGAEAAGFYARPGFDLVATIGSGPIRGMMETDFGLFAVSGSGVYRLDTSFGVTFLGSMPTASGPVSIAANTKQVAFFDGTAGTAWSQATGYITLSLPFSNPGTAVYQDGFVVVNQVGTFNLYQSNLNDLTTWQALNFSTEDGQPDNIVALADFHRQIVVFKELHTAFWINAGNNGFVFQRLEGVYMERGCVASASVALCNESLCWLGGGTEGQGVVYLTKGYEAQRISTPAIEFQIASYSTISDAIGFAILLEGHTFYVLIFPTGNATWVFDVTVSEKTGIKWWFEWLAFSAGSFNRWTANCAAEFAGKVLVGSYLNGQIFALDLNTLTDNGAIKKTLRSWRHVPEARFTTDKCNYLDIGCDTGNQVPPGANPQFVLRQSFDSGDTWSAEMYRPAGLTGQTSQDVRWNRLGATRRGLNSSRTFELSTTDQFRIGWTAAETG